MPKAFPYEFRQDVIAVARKGESSMAQIARDFGISESCLARWLKIADRQDGLVSAGGSNPDTAEGSRAASAQQAARAGERGPAPGDGLLCPRRAAKMMYPLVLDLAADKIPVAVTCRVLGFSAQAFYAWRKRPVCRRDYDDAHLINAALDIHHDDPGFGYRFIADELPARGVTAGRNRVSRLCSAHRIWSVFAKKPA